MININLFFNVLKECDSLIINTSKSKDSDIQINEEINSIYDRYKNEINKSKLIQYTYRSVFGYIIRRNYCPSSYFINTKFFSFDEYLKEKQKERNRLIKFTEDEFIKLREINSSELKITFFAFHIDSQCLLVMKEIYNSKQKIIKRKINFFFENYCHRCLIKCYGFIECEQYSIFIIDFMSNESIDTYMDNYFSKKVDFYFSFMIIIRIFESICYLHLKHLIHCDIRPQNMLLDHNHVPYLCDLEKIRSVDDNDEHFTLNFGTIFSSTEQIERNNNEKISYQADIYSFGLLVYYLFEKKIVDNIENFSFVNTPKVMQDMVLKCIKYSQNLRPEKEEIKKRIIEIIKSHYYFEPSFIKESFEYLRKDYIDLYLKESIQLFSQRECVDELKMNLNNLFSILLKEIDVVSFKHKLGECYKNGQFGKADYLSAKELFEISSKHGYSDSLIESFIVMV